MHSLTHRAQFVVTGSLAAMLGAAPALAGNQTATQRVSVATGNVQSNGFSSDIARNRPSISGDGRFVAFESQATNLVPGDTNNTSDIFVHDRGTGVTTRVSVSTAGAQATSECIAPEITPDGRFVLFTSSANNLVSGEVNNSEDVFVHDRQTATTVCVSVTPTGQTGAGSSGPGGFDSFYRRPMSADGRYVAFASTAGNLVAADTNFTADVFRRDMLTGTTVRVSVDATGAQANGPSISPSISSDGRFIAFESTATNLLAGDTNGTTDVFVVDVTSGAVVRANTSAAGAQANFLSYDASISGDGLTVAFQSVANNLVANDTNALNDLFVKRLDTGAIVRANLRPGGAEPSVTSDGPMLSRDGRFVAFWSWDPMLVLGDNNGTPDVFLRDLQLGVTQRASVGLGGAESDSRSWFPDLSSDELSVVFSSAASNLIVGDTNNKYDVFVYDRALAGPAVFCSAKVNSFGCTPAIFASGTPTVGPGSFTIGATQVLNNKSGVLFYGYGSASAPMFGGTRCAALPLRRTPIQSSGGNPPPEDCSGAYSFDMHAWIVSGVDPALLVGARVAAQYWSRDPGSMPTSGLTDAVAFTVCP